MLQLFLSLSDCKFEAYKHIYFAADNASDATATKLEINHKTINETPVLEFRDDGKGMNAEELYRKLRYV